MAYDNIEIEIKHPLQNPSEVMEFLNNNAELVKSNIFQKDTYYTLWQRDFLKKEYPYEWLRLRESNKWSSINYKHFYPENEKISDYCEEFETEIDNAESIKKIFANIDIQEAVIVEKNRTIWMFENVEISLDEVTWLWTYIELEITTAFESPQKGKEYLYTIAEKIHAKLWEVDNRWYPYRILENKWYKFWE